MRTGVKARRRGQLRGIQVPMSPTARRSGGRTTSGVTRCRRVELGLGSCRFRIEVLESAGLNPTAVDETVDFVFFEPNYSPEAIGGDVALIDESVQRSRRDPQPLRRVGGAQPRDP